jgi:glutamate synthase (NADPH/NADH) large chain
VVLGTTGRNFGAGMSGGTAYVLDLEERLVNQPAIESGELGLDPLDDDDAALVFDLLRAHAEHTGSHVAEGLLVDPIATRARFTRVLPRDYQRVREAIARAGDNGLDISSPAVWAEIMEATRG